MIRRSLLLTLLLISCFAIFRSEAGAHYQESTSLELRLKRNLGFGMGGQIQGRFSLNVSGPDNLERVEFYIDDSLVGEDSTSPFGTSFNTGDYDRGAHTLMAIGYTSDGRELRSNRITREFASIQSVALIVGGIIVLVVGFRMASYYLARSKGTSSSADFGYLGGTICPNCGRPFGIHWWSIRLGLGRFDRCPHCGKWKMVNRTSAENLERAATLDQEAEPPMSSTSGQQADEDELLRRQLDDSRFSDD
jgi:hypothetical protein